MSKFKVGDRFRRVVTDGGNPPANFIAGYEGVVAKTNDICAYDSEGYGHSFECIEPINDFPVRTVTRREIVPGEYTLPSGGEYEVSECDDGPEWIVIDDHDYDAVGLREMARIFNEIADVLDEQKEAA